MKKTPPKNQKKYFGNINTGTPPVHPTTPQALGRVEGEGAEEILFLVGKNAYLLALFICFHDSDDGLFQVKELSFIEGFIVFYYNRV